MQYQHFFILKALFDPQTLIATETEIIELIGMNSSNDHPHHWGWGWKSGYAHSIFILKALFDPQTLIATETEIIELIGMNSSNDHPQLPGWVEVRSAQQHYPESIIRSS
ncbi:hypothetical protein AVEN_260258-1 [Araneus ventricosus]|uniref:Uncharacterized protein n=1 Tax=Araneus ventricosus TaxID=182803 RepID=A0A4Y2FP29_ARAVE|nr:hypothetical protein AVEN_260258-1 [Araneus ventricosus]